MFTYKDAEEAAREAKRQMIAAGRWLRVDETKSLNPADTMLVRRVVAAATTQGEVFAGLLRDYEVNKLFNAGVLYFERPAPR